MSKHPKWVVVQCIKERKWARQKAKDWNKTTNRTAGRATSDVLTRQKETLPEVFTRAAHLSLSLSPHVNHIWLLPQQSLLCVCECCVASKVLRIAWGIRDVGSVICRPLILAFMRRCFSWYVMYKQRTHTRTRSFCSWPRAPETYVLAHLQQPPRFNVSLRNFQVSAVWYTPPKLCLPTLCTVILLTVALSESFMADHVGFDFLIVCFVWELA